MAQFLNSEKYRRDITLFVDVKVSPSYVKECAKQAKRLNKMKDGDQACFILKKDKEKDECINYYSKL
jgi:hypothetical protein